jgi:small subunit ribosomal protein S8
MTHVDYPVGDFLTRVKNACLAGHTEMTIRKTNLIEAVAKTLVKMGYLSDLKVDGDNLIMHITQVNKRPLVTDVKLISKPGLRIYMGHDDIVKRRSPSQLIISTSKGVMSAGEAIKNKLGGEVIAEVL